MNPLPPQAYTKDTLLNAYAWLQNQSETIKEMARTPDILVSLYLKANRDGDEALDRPSIHNFKNELKHLASMMGELDKPKTPTRQSQASVQQNPVSHPAASPTQHEAANMTAALFSQMAAAPAKPDGLHLDLDEKSMAMIHEVKEDFNLTSEAEALRMLIKVGYTRAKTLLK